MARFAVVNQGGLVVNVVEWEGAEWLAPKDHYVVLAPAGDIGDSYDFEQDAFIKPDRTSPDPLPPEKVEQPTVESLQAELAAIKQHLNLP